MTFRIAVLQPIAHRPGEDEANIADAVAHIERAAAQGVPPSAFGAGRSLRDPAARVFKTRADTSLA